jgi:hypothetical protein
MMYKAYPVGISSTDERLDGIIERLRKGASLISESRALGYQHTVELKGALRMKLGKQEFIKLLEALVQVHARARRERKAGRRTTPAAMKEA